MSNFDIYVTITGLSAWAEVSVTWGIIKLAIKGNVERIKPGSS